MRLRYDPVRLEHLNQSAFLPRSLRKRFDDEEAEEMGEKIAAAEDADDEDEDDEVVDASIGIGARRTAMKTFQRDEIIDLASDSDDDSDDEGDEDEWTLDETTMCSDGLPKAFNREGLARRDAYPDEAELDRISFYPEWTFRTDLVRRKTTSGEAAHAFCMRTRGNASSKRWARAAALDYLECRAADYSNPHGVVPKDLEFEIVERGFNCHSCLERHFVAVRFSDCDAHYFCKQCGVLGRDVLGKDACFCASTRCRAPMRVGVEVGVE